MWLLGWLLLAITLGAAERAQADDLRPWQFRHTPCVDRTVQKLVGMEREEAIRTARGMNIQRIRFLHPLETVLFEANPERLTLVIGEDARVWRAFCR
ncbi:MAG: hypothetical protein EAZ99_10630 [Alphaproteobacteria bacterium]|nr:hypothetical protein [Alphaproteobacteria bacterium]TAD89209.1 MAG: hypothetical protein EAZ99_10630 [Alphaproteobacteria bacterium]